MLGVALEVGTMLFEEFFEGFGVDGGMTVGL